MPEVVLPFGASGSLPAICVLTGRRDRVESREITLRGRSAVDGLPATCRLALPFHADAWSALVAQRREVHVSLAIGALSLLVALVGALFSPWVVLVSWPATVGALAMALTAWRDLQARSPRLLLLGKDGVELEVPSDEAAETIREHLDGFAAARRRLASLRRRVERARALRRERAREPVYIDARCPDCQTQVVLDSFRADPRDVCPLCTVIDDASVPTAA